MSIVLVELPQRRVENAVALTCALSAKVDAINADRCVPLEVLRRRPKPFRRVFAPPLSPAFFRRLHRISDALHRQEAM